MKNLHLIFLIVISFGFSAQAQTIIPRIGLSYSMLRADEYLPMLDNQLKGKIGYNFGVGFNFPLTSIDNTLISIQPEFSLVQKGFVVDAKGDLIFGGELTYKIEAHQKYTLNYIEIPLLVKFETGSENLRFSLFFGPAVSFALGGKYKSELMTRYEDEINVYNTRGKIIFYDSDVPDEITLDHNIDFGAIGGASITLFNRFIIDARFGTSFTNLKHDEKTKNQAIQLSVGVPIFL